MLYLYAIAAPDRRDVPDLRGLEEAAVRAVPAGGLAAVVSDHDGLLLEPNERAVARHADVVERLMDAGTTVLPARFGRAFADETALAEAVERQAGALSDALELVRGCVELGVRVVRRDDPQPAPSARLSSGREYMESLYERRTRELEMAAAIHEPLARLSAGSRQRPLGTRALLLSGAYLVRREHVDEFRREVERIQQERVDVALVLTGPWPPYSFTPEAS